ncbi:MAG: hypothetical protein ACFFAS_06610 [Promethearchaeota archaeon]
MENQEDIIYKSRANYFGRMSRGYGQLRGSGKLTLTKKSLHFNGPAIKELTIPYSKIIGITTPRLFLGKSKGMRLLQVNFENEQGDGDAAAWLVGGLQNWILKIELVAHQDDKFGPPIKEPDVFKKGYDVSGMNIIATSRTAHYFGQESL